MTTIAVPVVHEADVAALADADVVENAHAHEFADFSEAAGDLDILIRG